MDNAAPALFLLLLVAGDAAFIVLHLLRLALPAIDSPLYSLGHDRGHAEFYQYIKYLWIAVLLVSVAVRARTFGYAAWALVFGYLLLDDSLEIHETAGAVLAAELQLAPRFGMRPQDFGELFASALAALVLLALLAWHYLRGSNAFRRTTRHLLALLLALASFGVLVDALHSVFRSTQPLASVLGIVEDAGEMLVVSLAAWYVLLLNARDGDLPFRLKGLAVGTAKAVRGRFRS